MSTQGHDLRMCHSYFSQMLVSAVGAHNVFLFADDTAVVVDRVRQLVQVREAFEAYRAATALVLKDTQCVLIPLLRASTDEETVETYRALLTAEVPAWRGFRVAMSATSLGVPMGMNVTPGERWDKPLKKFADRVSELSRSTSSPAATVRHAEVYAVPVLTYIALTSSPVPAVRLAEALMWQRALRFPLKALPIAAHNHMSALGLTKIAPLEKTLRDILVRSSGRHTDDVIVTMAMLAKLREDVGPLAAIGRPGLAHDRVAWRAPAHAGEMELAMKFLAEEDQADARLRRGRRRGGRRDHEASCMAAALLQRVRRWFPEAAIADAYLAAKCSATIAPLASCSPLFGVALLRTWCDGWKTASRRGFPVGACILCSRPRGDTTRHLMRCPSLWRAVMRVSAIPMPASLAEAVALRPSEALGAKRTSGRAAPLVFVARLALSSGLYHKLKARCNEENPAAGPSTARRSRRRRRMLGGALALCN